MKKLILVLVFVLTLIGIGLRNNEVKAITMNFDYYNVSPRFQYLEDDDGNLIPFEFVLSDDFETSEEVEIFNVILQQVDYNGNFIKTLEIFEVDYQIYNSTIIVITTTAVIGNEDYNEPEYVDVSTLNYLDIIGVYVNGNPINFAGWDYSEDGDFVILDPSASTVGDSITLSYRYEQSTDYTDELYYDWSGLQFFFSEVAFYRLKYNDMILFTGAVMKTPINVLEYDVDNIEYGDFISKDDGLVDFTDQEDFTTNLSNEDFWILHFRVDVGIINALSYRTIQITNINSNTVEFDFTTDELLYIQGGNDYNFYNSFIVMPLSETLGEGLYMTNESYNDKYDPLLHNYSEGSYFIALVDQYNSNALEASASVVWNIVDDDKYPFELRLLKDEIALDELQRLMFIKNNELISSSYTTTLARDSVLLESYIDEVNVSNFTYAVSYNLKDTLVEDDCVNTVWYLEPIFVPYSLIASDYTIELSEEYCVIGETDISGHINNALIYYALDTEIGGIFFSIFVLIFFNVLLIFITKETFVYAIVNIIIVLVLSFMGIIPMWLIIAVFILGFIGLKWSMTGGRRYE